MEDTANKSGIKKASDGAAYIPASKRADGSTRKEIRVRPGYTPPEDIETYKNRNAQAFQNRGSASVPGADAIQDSKKDAPENKSKNAKRREAARKKAQQASQDESELISAMTHQNLADNTATSQDLHDSDKTQPNTTLGESESAEREKKVRNQLKKLRGVKELKEKKVAGEKLSHDQLLKIGKESELIRDLRKLGYEGLEIEVNGDQAKTSANEIIEADEKEPPI